MKSRIIQSMLIGLCLIVYGCEEPFENPEEIQGGQLSIYGRVSNLQGDSYVELGRTVDKNSRPDAVKGASVRVTSSSGEIIEFSEGSDGRYHPSNEGFRGTIGQGYFLEVTTPDGESYKSATDVLNVGINIDSVYSTYERRDFLSDGGVNTSRYFVSLYLDTDFSEIKENTFVRWDVDETFLIAQTQFPRSFPPSEYVACFVTQNSFPQLVNLQDPNDFVTNELLNQWVGERLINYAFQYKFAFSVYQRVISRESYEYWRDVKSVTEVTGSVFDTPPAVVRGNIENVNNSSEIVLGVFETTGASVRRIFYYPESFDFRMPQPCEFYSFNGYYPGFCLDCLTHQNSTYEPDQWFLVDSVQDIQ